MKIEPVQINATIGLLSCIIDRLLVIPFLVLCCVLLTQNINLRLAGVFRQFRAYVSLPIGSFEKKIVDRSLGTVKVGRVDDGIHSSVESRNLEQETLTAAEVERRAFPLARRALAHQIWIR